MAEGQEVEPEVVDVDSVAAPRPEITKATIERLLRDKSERVTIRVVDDNKKRSECWKRFCFSTVDGVSCEKLVACH